MSVTLRLLILTSLGLGACSGGDSSDDATDEDTISRPSTPTPAQSERPMAATEPNAPIAIDEDAPDVTGIDESTAPRGEAPASGTNQQAGEASTVPAGEAVPSSELCQAVADWDPEWVAFEEEVLELVNDFRSQPADCGVEGDFEPAAPLTMNPILRCSARLHSLDMYERDYFEHDTPDGVDPFERMAAAGFVGSGGGENIALGQSTPAEVMAAWMDSDGHCANVMRAAFDTIGVGYHPGAGQRGLGSNYWTQNFGAPRFRGGGGSQR